MAKHHHNGAGSRFFRISISHLYLLCLLVTAPLFCTPATAVDKPTNRVSLAISGGASKGAYEAGLIWGMLEVLRQAEKTKDWSVGGQRLPIEITSLAGTSAGGINTVLSAIVWAVNPENKGGFSNRIDDNLFRDVWLTPDINRLLPPEADSSEYLPDDALLSRKDLVSVARQMREKWRRPGTFQPGLRIPFGLTVTRVEPETMIVSGVSVESQRFYIPFEMRIDADGSATFYFDPEDYPLMTDPSMLLMPWPADGLPYSISDQQVEDALLTTSAFPIGLGRKKLQYCRQELHLVDDESVEAPLVETTNTDSTLLQCPDGFDLSEGEFADGGLFDNLPIGLARKLSESSLRRKNKPMPVNYVYLDPERIRYKTETIKTKGACQGDNPPEACRELTYNLASEMAVLGGAIGTARKYELYRELTGSRWRLNLSQICQNTADIIDADGLDVQCDSSLPFFSQPLRCSDRLRYAARLLENSYSHQLTPIIAPISEKILVQEKIASSCIPASESADPAVVSSCQIDTPRIRTQLVNTLVELSEEVSPDDDSLKKDILKSAVSIESDRRIHLVSCGNPITGLLLDSFGAFLDYKFREYDYYAGIYDAIVVIADTQCTGNYPFPDQHKERSDCRDRLSEQLYSHLGVSENPKSDYAFALMARQEFGAEGALRFAYEPMPEKDKDTEIIFDGLKKTFLTVGESDAKTDEVKSHESIFFSHLSENNFEPTQPPDGSTPLLAQIIEDPDYWSYELVNRATNRLVFLEQNAEDIYEAREPDPEKREKANTVLMGAGAFALRTSSYKYPDFTFAPSTAPEPWFWRNIIPYEVAFDLNYGDSLFFWQPTWRFDPINTGIRLGLGFTGGMFNSSSDKNRENYGVLGIDLTTNKSRSIFSGFGITPSIYHSWKEPKDMDQTSFGLDMHVNFLKNRLRISLGARDVIHEFEDTLFLTVGITDLPGLVYWLTR